MRCGRMFLKVGFVWLSWCWLQQRVLTNVASNELASNDFGTMMPKFHWPPDFQRHINCPPHGADNTKTQHKTKTSAARNQHCCAQNSLAARFSLVHDLIHRWRTSFTGPAPNVARAWPGFFTISDTKIQELFCKVFIQLKRQIKTHGKAPPIHVGDTLLQKVV